MVLCYFFYVYIFYVNLCKIMFICMTFEHRKGLTPLHIAKIDWNIKKEN